MIVSFIFSSRYNRRNRRSPLATWMLQMISRPFYGTLLEHNYLDRQGKNVETARGNGKVNLRVLFSLHEGRRRVQQILGRLFHKERVRVRNGTLHHPRHLGERKTRRIQYQYTAPQRAYPFPEGSERRTATEASADPRQSSVSGTLPERRDPPDCSISSDRVAAACPSGKHMTAHRLLCASSARRATLSCRSLR